MRHASGLLFVTAIAATACAGAGVRTAASRALRPEVRLLGAREVVEVRTSKPSYLALVSFLPQSTPMIAQGGPEPGRHLVPLDPAPLKTVGHGGISWLSGRPEQGAVYQSAQCQLTRVLVGRDAQGRAVYETAPLCAYAPMPAPYNAYDTGVPSAGSFLLVIATDTPLAEARLRKAAAAVSRSNPQLAARQMQDALFDGSAGEWSIVVK